MDRREAIQKIEAIIDNGQDYGYWTDAQRKALDLAIEVLGRTDTDCISRQDVTEAIEGVDWYHVNSKGELVHGSTSDEESWYRAEDIYKAIEALPPVTHDKRTETHGVCSDCISRQAAIEALDRIGSVDTEADREYARDIFDNLPPVTPTGQQGHGRLIDADKLLQELFIVDEEEWTTPEIRAILENSPSVTPT